MAATMATGRRLERFDVVGELDVGRDVLASRGHGLPRMHLRLADGGKALTHSVRKGGLQRFNEPIGGTRVDRPVRHGDDRFYRRTRRRKSGVREAFAFSMKANHGLEEEPVRERAGFGVRARTASVCPKASRTVCS